MSMDRSSTSLGFVALVGAGPGDVGLLTLRGKELLEAADVIVYDALANPKLLRFAKEAAQQIYVGKRAAQHAMPQEQISRLLVELARQGKQVVRLKGGDPFVFGRGGEECQLLARAGVRFEVVPGITAAIAAAAYAGIPITHRDFNTGFTLVTGHESDDSPSTLDFATLAKLPCVGFYMGVKSLADISQKLTEHGMSGLTPVAVIEWATHPHQRTITGTLSTIAKLAADAKIGAPAITLVGNVVSLRQEIRWFDTRPLFGKTVLVTRTRDQASQLSAKLEAAGARVIEAPTIDVKPNLNDPRIEAALQNATRFDWLIFTSPNGPRAARTVFDRLQLDARALANVRVAAVGHATAQAVAQQLAIRADLVSDRGISSALLDQLVVQGDVAGKKFLLLRADIAAAELADGLRNAGAATVDDLPVYHTLPATSLPEEILHAIQARLIDCITFTSGSTARNLTHLLGSDYPAHLSHTRLVSIGPSTSKALELLRLKVDAQADESNLDALVVAVIRALSRSTH
jgi:uroporphyrinogen III methyltransferase / synthase